MSYKTIMVALSGKGNEIKLIDESVRIKNSFNAKMVVIHVNDPHAGEMSMMMDSPGHRFTEEDIRNLFRSAGHEEVANRLIVRIITATSIHKAISDEAKETDLLILGHQKMNVFKENFFDSVDEGIVNRVSCPVLVVPKN